MSIFVKDLEGSIYRVSEDQVISREALVDAFNKAQDLVVSTNNALIEFDRLAHVITEEEAQATLDADNATAEPTPEAPVASEPVAETQPMETPAPVAEEAPAPVQELEQIPQNIIDIQ